jgi:hypothetical protein
VVDLNDIRIDMNLVSIREYRALFGPGQPQDQEDATIAKAAGITVDELLSLSQPDYRRLCKRFFDAAREPLSDPN